MNQIGKNRIILVSIAIVVIVVGGYFVWQQMIALGNDNSVPKPISSADEWKIFANTRFEYTIDYSNLVQIMAQTDGLDPQVDSGVDFFVPGKSNLTISVQSPSDYKKYLNEHNFTLQERKSYEQTVNNISSNLQTYTETIYQYQVNNPNPNAKDRQVGPLEETVIDGQKAYRFTLTNSFAFDATGNTGYTIGNKPNMYVITESPSGDKFTIHYLVGDPISEKMFQSFKFVR